METTLPAMGELFLDASFAIALSATSDQHHDRAVELAEVVELVDFTLLVDHFFATDRSGTPKGLVEVLL
jgi:hypothetical protein